MAFGGTPYNGDGISRDKFKGQDPEVFWPKSENGLPVKIPTGSDSTLKDDEIEELPVELNYKSRMFELWDAKDKADFDNVNDHLAHRVYVQLNRRDEWIPEKKHVMVWLEWVEMFKVIPKRAGG